MLPRMRTRNAAKQTKRELEAEETAAAHRLEFARKQGEQGDDDPPPTSERNQTKKSKDGTTNSRRGLPTDGRSTPPKAEQTSSKPTELSQQITVLFQSGANALYRGAALVDTSLRSAYGFARGLWYRLLRGDLLPSLGLVFFLLKWIGIPLVLVAAIPLLISLYPSFDVLMQPLFWAIGLFHRSTSGVRGYFWFSPFCSWYCTTFPSFAAYTMSAACSKYVDVPQSGYRHPITLEGIPYPITLEEIPYPDTLEEIPYPDTNEIYDESDLPGSLIFSLSSCYHHQDSFPRIRDGITYPDKDLIVAMQADVCQYLDDFSTSLPEYYGSVNVFTTDGLHQVNVARAQNQRVPDSTGDDLVIEQKLLSNKMATLQTNLHRKYAHLSDPGLALKKEIDDAIQKNSAIIHNITEAYRQTEETRLAKRAKFGIARRFAKRLGMLPEHSTELAPHVNALEALRVWNDSATALETLLTFVQQNVTEVNSNWNMELKRTIAAEAKFELGHEGLLELNAYMDGIGSRFSEMQGTLSGQVAEIEGNEPRADADDEA
ncbi:MAG: hypothetical protein Q9208_006745 [Pyrenodesmia sp. 3 TL-2023]